MNKEWQKSMKRKRAHESQSESSQSIAQQSTKPLSVTDIRTKDFVVTGYKMVTFDISGMLKEHLLKRIRLTNIEETSFVQKIVSLESSKTLQAKIVEIKDEMMKSQKSTHSFGQLKTRAISKLEFLCGLKKNLVNDYSAMITLMKKKVKNIDELRDKSSSLSLDNEALNREDPLIDSKLCKVNDNVDFVLRQREKATLKTSVIIGEKAKLSVRLSQLQQSLEKERDQIKSIELEKEANVKTLDKLKTQIEQIKGSTSEEVQNYLKIKEEKSTVQAEQESLNVALVNVNEENEKLNNEIIDLKAKTNQLKKECGRIQQANYNLLSKEERERSKSEFDQIYLSLLTEVNNTGAKFHDLEIIVDERSRQYSELTQIQAEIAEKKQHHAEVESKLTALETKIMSRLNNISAVQKAVDKMEIKRAKTALSLVKPSGMENRVPNYVRNEEDAESNISTTVSSEELLLETELDELKSVKNL